MDYGKGKGQGKMDEYKKIPYGISSYGTIRRDNCYYVDKTSFIPKLEDAGKFLFLIRPRRFGKSSLLTLLEGYYDLARKDEFEFLFKDTYIGNRPTQEKNAHLILAFNFSRVNPSVGKVEESFVEHTDACLDFFGYRYREFLDDFYFAMMDKKKSPHGKLESLLRYAAARRLSVYVLIDEYDNFANTILSTEGPEKYHELINVSGFFRFFFAMLKGATDRMDSGIARMLITGVSPVTMDDVTSGFNIGRNISLNPVFNELLGFTRKQVAEILDYYGKRGMAVPEGTLDLIGEWYGNYRFSKGAAEQMYNPDMILYFVQNLKDLGHYPEYMIDQNVRIDYTKLRHLMVLDKRLNGNFSYLRDIVKTQGTSPARVASSFPVSRLAKPSNFISLLYYFGLLSRTSAGELQIPNQTVRTLMYEYIRRGYEDAGVFRLDFWHLGELIRNLAYGGDWEPVFRFLASEIEKQTSIRDYLTGEKVIQTFLLAYLNVSEYFIVRSEEEMGKGFADLYMEPFLSKYPDVAHSCLIELKYIPRGEFSEEKMEEKLAEARNQLAEYAKDERLAKQSRGTKVKLLAMVFSGWELKEMREQEFQEQP